MKIGIVLIILAAVCLAVYHPHSHAEFVLDDYYTVVRNPLIKSPFLYHNIWTSRLFDAHPDSGYIKFGYYRPVLQFSWIPDYRLFGLKACGFQWMNLLIHLLNCLLVYLLLGQIFGQGLALKSSLLFSVLPTQEWVVRYITGRGDELSALFALLSLICFLWVLKSGLKTGYLLGFICLALSALTREVALSYILYGILIYAYSLNNSPPLAGGVRGGAITPFSLCWILIGILPLAIIYPIIPKLGNILALHLLYFASIGLCLWMASSRWFIALLILFAALSGYQGRFWTSEEALLRHTRHLELWPHTVVDQQLLMKYDDDVEAIKDIVAQSHDLKIKSMWLRRLGVIYFERKDLDKAQVYFDAALSFNSTDVDTLNALAVLFHYKGQEDESLRYLNLAYDVNPGYPDTLRTLGIYYYVHKDMPDARVFLTRSLVEDPDNPQARELLRLANKAI